MIQDYMRKHKRVILFFIILLIGVPFVFVFGMPSWFGTDNAGVQDDIIANVGPVPVYASELRRGLQAAANQRARGTGGERPTYRELDAEGVASDVLQQIFDSTFITLQEQQRGLDVHTDVLQEEMKKWPQFQDAEGNFDPVAWNIWVQESGIDDWNAVYDDIRRRMSRQVYLGTMLAPAKRVLEKDIEKQLLEEHTKLKVKFAQIAPKVEPTEEDAQKHYDENPDTYKTPDRRIVEFLAVSLQPPPPDVAAEIVEKARGGADFAELAGEYSTLKTNDGGFMGWKRDREDQLEHHKPLFQMAKGEVSDPIPTITNYFIYWIEDEREADDGVREILPRQILLEVKLTPEQKAERQDKADQIAARAKEASGLEDAAGEFELEVGRSGWFDRESSEVENIARVDARTFARAFDNPDLAAYDVVSCQENLYIPKVVQLEPGVLPPLEDVREEVVEDTIAALKQTDEYKARVEDYANKIKEGADSLEKAAELFPELAMEIKESSEFTRKDYLYRDKLYLQTTQIFEQLGDAEPGTLAGPLADFRGDSFFLELLERTPPSEEDKESWEEEEEQLRQRTVMMAERNLLEDFLQDLRERSLEQVQLQVNQELIDDILGRNIDTEEAAGDTAEEAPAEAAEPAADGSGAK